MSQNAPEVTKEKLLKDFNTVVAETEQLLRDASAGGGEKAAALRHEVELKLRAAREKLMDIEHLAVEKTKAAAQATDNYVHDRPWQAIGITAGVSVLVGITIGLLLNRNR
jgi:ElaB/YqjD/DUF883 family membrane-anchored ribosome-binding protein